MKLHRLILPAIVLVLAGCGKKDTAASVASGTPVANFPGMEADLARTLKEQANFYVFKPSTDFAKDTEGLTWQDGSDLPEFADPAAKKGGTLRAWMSDFPSTFRTVGPDSNDSFRGYLLDNVEMNLLRPHPNAPGRFYPELTKDWAVDRAHKTVFFHVDPAAKWSDGTPVTTEDLVFTFYFMRSPHLNDPWSNDFYAKTYERITIYDAHTFAITLRELKPDIESRAGELNLYPKKFFKDFGPGWEEKYNWRITPTNGAYLVHDEDVKKQVSVTLTRKTDWWGQDKRFLRYRFNPDRIRLTVIREPDKAFEAFLRGDLDLSPIGLLNQPKYWYDKLANDQRDVAAGYIVKSTFFNNIPCPDLGLWINEAKPLLGNRDLREGLQYATNMELICQQFYRGDAVVQQTRSDGYGWRVHPTIAARPFDPVKARELFAKAGFTKQGPDGILVNAQGQRLSFTITAYLQSLQDRLTILKEEARKSGLEYNLEILDSTTGFKKMLQKEHDIALAAFNRSVEMYPRYWEFTAGVNAYEDAYLGPDGKPVGKPSEGKPNPSPKKPKVQNNNFTSTFIPRLDELIEQYDHAESMEQIKTLAAQIEQIIHDDASWINGWKMPFYRLAYWRWVKWPAGFSAMQSRDQEEFWVMWLDPEAEKETTAAKAAGRTFPPQVLTFDQFKQP
ncbi:MAG: extracellular solute-binding protein [Verrucomicrobiota bacterium]